MGSHYKHLASALLISTHNMFFYGELEKIILDLSSNTLLNTEPLMSIGTVCLYLCRGFMAQSTNGVID